MCGANQIPETVVSGSGWPVTFHGVGKAERIIVQNAEMKKIFIHIQPAISGKMWIAFLSPGIVSCISLNLVGIPSYSAIPTWPAGFFPMVMPHNFYQTRKLSTFAFSLVFCYSKPMEGQGMERENPETKLIRKQARYIRALEEQLETCKEPIKAQELLIEKQGQALALFADAFSREEK